MPTLSLRCLLAASLLGVVSAFGVELADLPDYRGALRALADGLVSVTRVKALRLLDRPDLTAAQKLTVVELAAEACIKEGRLDEALHLLSLHPSPNSPYWAGVAWLAKGNPHDAYSALQQCTPTAPLYPWAKLAEAHALFGQGREAAARRTVRDMREHPDPKVAAQARHIFNELELNEERATVVQGRLKREQGGKDARVQFLRARAAYQENDLATAERLLRDALTTIGLGGHGHDAMTVLLAQVLAKKKPEAGIEILITFAESFNGQLKGKEIHSDYWTDCFTTLEALCHSPEEVSLVMPSLTKWAADPTVPERHGHASYMIARLLRATGRKLEALGLLEGLLALYPQHPRHDEALRLTLQLYRELGIYTRIHSLAQQWKDNVPTTTRPSISFVLGMMHFATGDYQRAIDMFVEAADTDRILLTRRRSLYNAAVSAIKAGQAALFATLLTQLQQAGDGASPALPSDGASADDLKLDNLFAQASAGETVAAEAALNAFIQDPANTDHLRLAEACVTLAEIQLLDQPPRAETADKALQKAATSRPNAAIQERLDYVKLWLEEARSNLDALITQGEAFLKAWPQSTRAPEVHMKIAEASYRQQNFATARTHFEIIATDWPASPHAEAALYFAGKSALAIGSAEGINTAITLWEQVAEANGPLAFEARVQQAAAKRLQDEPEQAIKLIDILIPEAPKDRVPGLLCDKAEILLSQAPNLPASYTAVSTLLDPARLPANLPFFWQARTTYLRALALKAQKQTDEALEACYDTIEAGTNPESPASTPSDLEWLYRVGFLALDYLEELKQWEPAAQLAERLAKPAAPLAKEAATRANRIRLEHFLWDGKK
ncbi:MAG: tetratricopeptide repeat protein [Verrucomicrobiaceae bacterium]|nr:tetratricopeptide repeat protein [Verrucomicrobiaceae bacterium]